MNAPLPACSECDAAAPTTRLPRGWKRLPSQAVLCKPCFQARYKIKAVTFPIASPLEDSWEDLWGALSSSWREASQLSCWAMTQLRCADPADPAVQDKIPKYKPLYLYPEARRIWPNLGTGSVVSLLQSVTSRYLKCRFDVAWRFAASLPTHRYPVPLPVHVNAWSAELAGFNGDGEQKECPVISFRVQSTDAPEGKRFRVRLRGGTMMRRQLGAFRQLVAGEAIPGELVLLRAAQHGTNSRRTHGSTTEAGGGKRKRWAIHAKLVGYWPKPKARHQEGTLHVRTAADAFLVAVLGESERVWTLNGDLASRWIAEHEGSLQSLSDDQKFERRVPARRRRRYQHTRTELVERHARRMDTWLHQSTAMVARFAARSRVAEVRLTIDGEAKFSRFPWYRWQAMLADKLPPGVELLASGAVVEDPPGALESDT